MKFTVKHTFVNTNVAKSDYILKKQQQQQQQKFTHAFCF